MNIYEKIFARLEELHMSQIEMSRRTGIATSTISDWRKKKINPQADKLVAICKALDMSLVDLLCDEEDITQTASVNFLVDDNYMLEILRKSDAEMKRRLIRYFELLELCKEINDSNTAKKHQRNISVIQDIDGNNIVVIHDIRFKGKRSVKFALPVYRDDGEIERYNVFHASMLIRHSNDGKMYLYDIIDIKKETSNSLSE